MNPAVWLLVPDDVPSTGGNTITALRLAAGLGALGWRARVLPAGAAANPPPGTLVHALHAIRSGRPALAAALRSGGPLVVSMTGTDMDAPNADLLDVLRRAQAIVAFHAAAADDLTARLPELARRVEIIAPGVAAPAPSGPSERPRLGWLRDDVVFLLPGGLRPVKQPLFALDALARLRAGGLPVRLALCGPPRDPEEAERVLRRLAGVPWAAHLGVLPHDRMPAVLRAADVVLNTSRAEGLANTVLEAMACARPVLAADIPGNRAAIRPGIDGLLYRAADTEELFAGAARLAAEPALRRRLGRNAARTAARRFSAPAEAAAHDRLYRRLLASSGWQQRSATQA